MGYMSSFLNGNLKDLIDNLSSESVALPEWLATTVENVNDKGLTSTKMSEDFIFSSTSNNLVGGGFLSTTSELNINTKNGKNEVNKLLSMLTSESNSELEKNDLDT